MTNSAQNYWGWAYSGPNLAPVWANLDATTSGSTRFKTITNAAVDPSGTYNGRESFIRWDGVYAGGTFSLGNQSGRIQKQGKIK